MNLKELSTIRRRYLDENLPYNMLYWKDFRYEYLQQIIYRKKGGAGLDVNVNDIIIMADTETSRKRDIKDNRVYTKSGTYSVQNHVVVWTISLRAYGRNLVTLYGRKPSEMVECFEWIHLSMKGERTLIYFHNLSYDYVFIRKFLFQRFDYPVKELSTKPHYPIMIQFNNGIVLKDSLILAQRSLERWANDLDVEHKKAVGSWEYTQIRNQDTALNADELHYIENDTLAGVECIDATMKALNKKISSMPYTATGIPREELKKIGQNHKGKQIFNKMVFTYTQYKFAETVYHGGYVHANRHEINFITEGDCFDFCSSYPYHLLFKMPMGKFVSLPDKPLEYILSNSENNAFMFTMILINVKLKDRLWPMPVLQYSKAQQMLNARVDNGRILAAALVIINVTEQDAHIINEQYEADRIICTNIITAVKDYLPRHITDYVYQLFKDKTMLKGSDPVLYSLAKAKLNSVYGMMVQKNLRDNIIENYESGEYERVNTSTEEDYERFVKSAANLLPYQWGIWCTAYAMRDLFELGKCIDGTWLYSDTDSAFGTHWDMDKLNAFNDNVKSFLQMRGYGAVEHNGKEYWLGIAEHDKSFSEFKTLGSKRYCYRDEKGLHLTVSGVPKNGVNQLNDDINNFCKGFIFDGRLTGKLTHSYMFVEGTYTDSEGNETGDSIDLTYCDYLLDTVKIIDLDDLYSEEINLHVYDEGRI